MRKSMSYKFFTNPFIEEPFFHEIAMQLGGIKKKVLLTERMLMQSVDVLVVAGRKRLWGI